jgi:hypothetical protein
LEKQTFQPDAKERPDVTVTLPVSGDRYATFSVGAR